MGNVDIDVLKNQRIIDTENRLDKMFLLTVEFAAKSLVMNKQVPQTQNGESSIGDIINAATYSVLERLSIDDDCLEEYTKAVVLLMRRGNNVEEVFTHMFDSHRSMSPYG